MFNIIRNILDALSQRPECTSKQIKIYPPKKYWEVGGHIERGTTLVNGKIKPLFKKPIDWRYIKRYWYAVYPTSVILEAEKLIPPRQSFYSADRGTAFWIRDQDISEKVHQGCLWECNDIARRYQEYMSILLPGCPVMVLTGELTQRNYAHDMIVIYTKENTLLWRHGEDIFDKYYNVIM